MSLLCSYDIILDCTDNSPTRYLLSDTAVHLGKPLVSGAAQKFDGQLCTYNLGENGPCYRCLFPKPPSHEVSGTCEETGILGAVTGVIGNLQALEAIKIITGLHGKSYIPPTGNELIEHSRRSSIVVVILRARGSTLPNSKTSITQADMFSLWEGRAKDRRNSVSRLRCFLWWRKTRLGNKRIAR